MAKQLILRKGDTSAHGSFTGANAEVTVNTEAKTAVVHDGSTIGGFPLARADGGNTITNFRSTGIDDNSNALAMTIDASEHIGINETAPNTYLHVTGKSGYTTAAIGEVSGLEFVRFQPNSSSEDSLWIHNGANILGLQASTNADSSTAEHMSLNAFGGNIGIGTGTAAPDVHLSIEGSGSTAYAATLSAGRNSGSDLLWLKNSNASAGYVGLYFSVDSTQNPEARIALTNEAGFDGDLTFAIRNPSDTGNIAERMRITSAGNIGIGTGASAPKGALHIANPGSLVISNYRDSFVTDGSADDGGQTPYIYRSIDEVSMTFPFNYYGNLIIQGATESNGGEIVFATGTTPYTRMSISNTGQITLGNVSPNITTSGGGLHLSSLAGDVYLYGGSLAHTFAIYNSGDSKVLLNSNGDSYFIGGDVAIGLSDPSYRLDVAGDPGANWVMNIDNTSTPNPYGLRIAFSGSADNDTGNTFLGLTDSSQYRLRVYSDGSVQNVDGTYGSALSDERLKIDIKDANSQWEDVKNINIINYKRLVDGEDSKSMLSVIAQQAREISPNLIGERLPEVNEIEANPLFGTLYVEGDDIPEGKEIGDIKEVKEKVLFFKDSIFFWKCAKALQEAMVKIEILQTKVTALEAA